MIYYKLNSFSKKKMLIRSKKIYFGRHIWGLLWRMSCGLRSFFHSTKHKIYHVKTWKTSVLVIAFQRKFFVVLFVFIWSSMLFLSFSRRSLVLSLLMISGSPVLCYYCGWKPCVVFIILGGSPMLVVIVSGWKLRSSVIIEGGVPVLF